MTVTTTQIIIYSVSVASFAAALVLSGVWYGRRIAQEGAAGLLRYPPASPSGGGSARAVLVRKKENPQPPGPPTRFSDDPWERAKMTVEEYDAKHYGVVPRGA